MKTFLALLALLLAACLGALALTFRAEVLPVADTGAIAVPEARPPADMSVAAIHAGRMMSAAGFAYRGGPLGEQRVFGMTGVLVRHPQGTLLIDSGFGRNVAEHTRTLPLLMRLTSKLQPEPPVVEQLRGAGIEPSQLAGIVITHAHWDHVSGAEDLAPAPVWLPQAELDFIDSGDRMTALARSLNLQYRVYGFPDGPYLGFESSYDVFKDGAVVIVPSGGHTPGSVIVFVTPPGDERYAFIGDLAWQKEGIELPAEKPWLSRRLVDKDAAAVRARLAQLHRLAELVPNLVIVPAHDRRVMESLPPFAR